MNWIHRRHRLRRSTGILAGLACALLASITAVPAALASPPQSQCSSPGHGGAAAGDRNRLLSGHHLPAPSLIAQSQDHPMHTVIRWPAAASPSVPGPVT